MKLFSTLYPHLKQLRINIKVDQKNNDDPHKCLSSTSDKFVVRCQGSLLSISHQHQDVSMTSTLTFPETISFPSSFQEDLVYDKTQNNVISFCIRDVEVSPVLVQEIRKGKEKRQDARPKPNPELMNDWIFCHSHHHDKDDKLNESDTMRRESNLNPDQRQEEKEDNCLESQEQVLSFLSSQAVVGSKVLLETTDPSRDSLFVQVLSPATQVFTANFDLGTNCTVESHTVCLFHFKNISLRRDRSWREDLLPDGDHHEEDDDDKRHALGQQLKSLRLSFDVEWMKVREETFCQIRHLITSSVTRVIEGEESPLSFNSSSSSSSSSPVESLSLTLGFLVL